MRDIHILALGLALFAAGCAKQPDSSPSAPAALAPPHAPRPQLVAAPQSAATSSPAFVPDEAGHLETVEPFLTAHCLKCHGPDQPEAGLRVDQHLPNDFLTRSVAERWSEVLNKLNSGEMPPKEEARPPAAEIAKVVDWISGERLRGEKARRGTQVVLRRLNRTEYNNTIRELTGVDMQPADEFPEDPAAGGFDNNGGALSLSRLQLELYIKAAQQVLDRAIVTQKERPPSIKWRFQVEEGLQEPIAYDNVPRDHIVTIDGRRMSVNPGCNLGRDGMTVLRQPLWNTCGDARFGRVQVPHPGYYIIRARAAGVVPPQAEVIRAAAAKHEVRQAEQGQGIADLEQRRRNQEWFEEHGRAAIKEHYAGRHYRYGPPRMKITNHSPGVDRVLGVFDVPAPPSAPATYEVRAWFEPVEGGFVFQNVYHLPRNDSNFWMQDKADFPRPELLVDWMEVEGPVYDFWPPSSHRRILIDSPHRGRDEEAYAGDVLAHFMRRAYRRPLRAGEVEAKLKLFREARRDRKSFEAAIKVPLIAVLSSPHFLFLAEPGHEDAAPRLLDNHELAARLSYFLWSSMPDDELARLAERGQLSEPAQLRSQADRLLADERRIELAKNFAGQWLKLRDVGVNPPSQMIYLEYDDHLETSMRGESEAFFAHILRHDLSALNFIQSDFLTINERLARFYGIEGVRGDEFRVVPAPPESHRGGVVTQASVLSVTSNGTRTSPVWRGVWILDRLLGDPPPPPPPNAGDIPPAAAGQSRATVRDRLRIHREQAQCAHCHNQIDPLGFALENFDASGQWRERESRARSSDANANDPPIDARANLPGGSEFVGVRGLQQELLKREDQFLRCLAEKLYSYALGRELGYADEPTLASAVAHMKQNGKTLRSLVHHIVTSDAFRSK